jgi:hypothetical protein
MDPRQELAMADSLTQGQLDAFERDGYLRLPETFAREAAIQLQERMWTELREDFGIDRFERRTWWQPMRSLHRAKRDPLQSAIASDRLTGAIGSLLGRVRWRVPSNWGVVLVTFPAGRAFRVHLLLRRGGARRRHADRRRVASASPSVSHRAVGG